MTPEEFDDALVAALNGPRGLDIARLISIKIHATTAASPLESMNAAIIDAVCRTCKVTPSEIYGRKRTTDAARARLIAMTVCRDLTGASFPEIGQIYGRDHTTVMSAHRTVKTSTGLLRSLYRGSHALAKAALGNIQDAQPVDEECETGVTRDQDAHATTSASARPY